MQRRSFPRRLDRFANRHHKLTHPTVSLPAALFLACNNFEVVRRLLFDRVLLRDFAPAAAIAARGLLATTETRRVDNTLVSKLLAPYKLFGEVA